eukprot:m51a1_g13851 hypothetical protein (119) ;mRNA; f:573132-573738
MKNTTAAAPRRTLGQAIARAFNRDIRHSSAEILAAAHWIKQVFALVCALAFAALGVTGWLGVIGFLGFSAMVVCMYAWSYLGDETLEFNELFGEGLPSALGIFLGVWILAYTFAHHMH